MNKLNKFYLSPQEGSKSPGLSSEEGKTCPEAILSSASPSPNSSARRKKAPPNRRAILGEETAKIKIEQN